MKKIIFTLTASIFFLLFSCFAIAGPVYKGSLTGAASGPFLASVNTNGSVFIIAWSDKDAIGTAGLVTPGQNGTFYNVNSFGVIFQGEIKADSMNLSITVGADNVNGTGSLSSDEKMLSYAGAYTAPFSGGASGNLTFGISDTTSGVIVVDAVRSDNIKFEGIGIVRDDGLVLFSSTSLAIIGKGQITGKSISGQWADIAYDLKGSFASPEETKPASSSGGSSGCFLHALGY